MTTTQHTAMPCSICNGVLAAEMLKTFTPERVAHEYVHTASRAQALTARVAELENALQRMVNFAIPVNCAKGKAVTSEWDINVAIARAALAKVTP